MELNRYSTIDNKLKREIVLLKAKPCARGKCSFCDYILDNDTDRDNIELINKKVLENVTGLYHTLEVIDSASCFELTDNTLFMIKNVIKDKNIDKLIMEAHRIYRNRLDEMRDYFQIPIFYKVGVETFDNEFRENVLMKGANFNTRKDIKKYYDSPCIMVGIKGQSKDMIDRDIDIIRSHFKHSTVSIFNENSTSVKKDEPLIKRFREKYENELTKNPKIDYLYENTDLGVG